MVNNNNNIENGELLAENKLILLYLMHNAKCTLSNLQILKLFKNTSIHTLT